MLESTGERRPSGARLKVLQICEATSAGVGRHTIELVRGLSGAGCEVHLLYAEDRIDAPFARGLKELSQVKSAVLPMARAPRLEDAAMTARARRYVYEHGPFDVIHGQSSKGGAIARLAGATTDASVVYTPHGIYTMSPLLGRMERGIYTLAERTLGELTDRILASSQEEYRHIRELGIAEDRLRVVLNGLEAAPVVPKAVRRAELGLPADDIVIGFVARLCPQKNPRMALRAFAELARTRPHVRLAVVGRGELEEECVALARSLGVADQVSWLGYRPGAEAMQAFDLLMLSSAYEGLAYVALERLFAGLPLVMTPVGGVSSAVVDGVDGFIAPCEDAPAMARALAKLVDDAALRESFGAAAQRRSSDFAIDKMVARVLDIYEECRRNRSGRRLTRRRARGSVGVAPHAPARNHDAPG